MATELMQARFTGSGRRVRVPLPCGHQTAFIPAGKRDAVRRCRSCRNHYLIECGDSETALVTDITCAACGRELNSEGDMWWCPGCGDEWDDETIRRTDGPR